MSDFGKIKFDDYWKIVRELYRNYISLHDHVSRSGRDMIEYGPVTISFLDLQYGVNELAGRKKEAFFYNVLMDMRQKDAAKIMKITTVSVGQYVESACRQLSQRYFDETELEAIGQYMLERGVRLEVNDDDDEDGAEVLPDLQAKETEE